MPRGFAYYPARSGDEALLLLHEHREAEPVAGCTNILVDARSGRSDTRAVVDIHAIQELHFAQRDDGVIRLGPLTTLAECLKSPFVGAQAPLLRMMAAEFAGPLIRTRATLGGNIAYASPAADSVPALLALGARLVLTNKARGSRVVDLADFPLGPRQTVLKPDELITEISIPAAEGEWKVGYFKFALRKSMAISIVSGAVALQMEGDKVRQARLALGAVAPVPYRVAEAEMLLRDQVPGEALINKVAQVAAASSAPIDDIRASAEYRRAMTEVMTRRMIQRALLA